MACQPIVVTTDFSQEAKRAYTVGAQLASRSGAALILVHVAEPPGEFFFKHGVGAASGVPRAPYVESVHRQLEDEATDEALRGLEVEAVLLDGSGPQQEQLAHLAQERQAEMVVAASSGHSMVGRLLLGSFLEKLIRISSVPVLTVRPMDSSTWKPLRVVVPTDFSENSKAVLPWIKRFWAEFHPTFLFVHVIEVETPLLEVPPPMGVGFAAEFYADRPGRARECFRELQAAELSGLITEFKVLHGRHYHQINAFAKEADADLVLLATHGWTGVDHLVMGSVAERVARDAPCSVLTVRPPPKAGSRESALDDKSVAPRTV